MTFRLAKRSADFELQFKYPRVLQYSYRDLPRLVWISL